MKIPDLLQLILMLLMVSVVFVATLLRITFFFVGVIGAMILGVVSSAAYSMLLRPEWQFILKATVTFLAIIAQRYLLDRRSR